MCNRWKLLIKFLKFKLKWRTILRKFLEKNILHQMFLFISNLRFETMHQTSKMSRCLKQIKLQIMEHLREKQCIAMWLKSFLMRIWILIKLGFHWIFLKLLMGPALVTSISWNQVCMFELIGDFRKIFNPLCMCNHYASYHLTLLHSQ